MCQDSVGGTDWVPGAVDASRWLLQGPVVLGKWRLMRMAAIPVESMLQILLPRLRNAAIQNQSSLIPLLNSVSG